MFIGLASLLLDSVDRDDLQAFIRRLAAKGNDILNPPGSKKPHKWLFEGHFQGHAQR
ncbi:MAG: hypothetical protein IT185_12395 [Acidobacteria bacterium]|nr:hypothetical protein [Acidobacteriota bacterium]